MGLFRREKDGEFDFDKLPEGEYFFSGKEGFVKVEVDKEGNQSWNLENWFASLDPDKNETQRNKIIREISKYIIPFPINPSINWCIEKTRAKPLKINLMYLFIIIS